MPAILGRKLGMSQVFEEDGKITPVTIIQCEPNAVYQKKTKEKDGYEAVSLAIESLRKPKKTRKYRVSREFRPDKGATKLEELKKGDTLTVKAFEGVKEVTVTGISKGKGFQGTIKRFHFASGPGSHGSHFHREPGAIGPRARTGKLHKGKKLPGHMGFERITLKRVRLVSIDPEKNLLIIKGQAPGPTGNLLLIKA